MATWTEQADAAGDVVLHEAGRPAKGEFRCVGCGYGVAVHDSLPSCPMCRGDLWEPSPWRPFTRTSAVLREATEQDLRSELLL
jgi:hypothetical protein